MSDLATPKTALELISKFQREDGKVPHEISQSASLVDWSKMPFQFASADATPLYIIAFHDYVVSSGDVEFARTKWDSIQRAFTFLRSTWDEHGFPKNEGVGHGWVEGGPLLPVKTELYQSSLGWAAMRDFAELAKLTGKSVDIPADLEQRRKQLNDTFWIADKNYYAFALRDDNSLEQVPSVEATVPMWFDVLDQDKAAKMVTLLAGEDHMTDWGMRINSSREPFYFPQGYHYGAVWPLFTGWASVGEYKVHRADAAYANLRANALLAFDGPLGHFTEVMSGDYYSTISYGSPHQIWSAAMVISPMLRGMLGLKVNSLTKTVTLAPHLPYSWNRLTVSNLKVASSVLSFTLTHSSTGYSIETRNEGRDQVSVEFQPSISLRAKFAGAQINKRPAKAQTSSNAFDQHVKLMFPAASGTTTASIQVNSDVGIDYTSTLPPYGTSSRNLKILSQTWSADRNTLTLMVSGRPGQHYNLSFAGPAPVSMQGATLSGNVMNISFPGSASGEYQQKSIIIGWSPVKR
jgi:hypothetical protein